MPERKNAASEPKGGKRRLQFEGEAVLKTAVRKAARNLVHTDDVNHDRVPPGQTLHHDFPALRQGSFHHSADVPSSVEFDVRGRDVNSSPPRRGRRDQSPLRSHAPRAGQGSLACGFLAGRWVGC